MHHQNIMNKYVTFFLIVIAPVIACKNERSEKSDTEWRLGWRMADSAMDENFELADLQFDSLLDLSDQVDAYFLTIGLETKHRLDKHSVITNILANQDEETLRRVCQSELLADMNLCQALSEEEVRNKALQIELIKMCVDDQAVRGNIRSDLISKYELDVNQITQDEAVAVDQRNRSRLKEIFKEVGFPTVELVGKDAMHSIFLIIQHSDSDEAWQKDQLINIERAVEDGDMDSRSYAYLYDRIKVNAGEKQLYGTQIKNVDPASKEVELMETLDVENLDIRRRKAGMMPIEMYKKFATKDL